MQVILKNSSLIFVSAYKRESNKNSMYDESFSKTFNVYIISFWSITPDCALYKLLKCHIFFDETWVKLCMHVGSYLILTIVPFMKLQ